MKVRVTDKNSPYCGQEYEGGCIYYDINHTGNSPDLFIINTPDGEKQILSTSIDTEHYWEQRRQEHIKKLGANIGDIVLITRAGGGSFKSGFNCSEPHKITNINSSGYVEFDNGEATTFRPDVTVIENIQVEVKL